MLMVQVPKVSITVCCRLWAPKDLQHVKTVQVADSWVLDCAYMPHARRLACITADRKVGLDVTV